MITEYHIYRKPTNCLDFAEINSNFSGVIMCYCNDKEVGIIQCCGNSWVFNQCMDIKKNTHEYTTFLGLINALIKNKECDTFKLIRFEH